MTATPCIFFSAFEISGDQLAAPIIARLRRQFPDVPIYAFGGDRMEAAGAQLIERTIDRSTMGHYALLQAIDHFKRRSRFKQWLNDHPTAVFVPTDAPAANWALCRLVKERWGYDPTIRGKVIHLVAPQVWAWANWRVKRLRKWSDLVLCLLPFEPQWFHEHSVPARFIGHPLFDTPLDSDALARQSADYSRGEQQLALLPGSRSGEVKYNWPVMLATFKLMKQRFPALQAMVGAADTQGAALLKELTPDWPDGLHLVTGQADAVIHWAQVVFAVSGTVTLHIARQFKPMAVLYRAPRHIWYGIFRWLKSTETFTLPNLIHGGLHQPHLIREFIPFWGPVTPLADELTDLFNNPERRAEQQAGLQQVIETFTDANATAGATDAIANMLHNSPGLD